MRESFASYDPSSLLSKTSEHCSQAVNGEKSQSINAYAAGLIDGEGCITIAHRNQKSFSARIDVGMSVKGMPCLKKLQNNFGGMIRKTRKQTEQWEEAFAWALFGKATVPFLEAILPYLELKKQQAMYAISLQQMIASLPQARKGAAAWTQEAIQEAITIRALVQELNQKGPSEPRTEGSFARLVGGKWITPQRDLFSSLQWAEFSQTWPKSGMTRNGIAFERPTSVRRIDENECGLLPTPRAIYGEHPGMVDRSHLTGAVHFWPTPQAHDATGGRGKNNLFADGHYYPHDLADAVMWPTPNVPNGGRSPKNGMSRTGMTPDGKKRQVGLENAVKLWPTPTAEDSQCKGNHPGAVDSLHAAVKMFPTPQATDWKRDGRPHGFDQQDLPRVIGGQLNPTWVEALMGYPFGWTDLSDGE